MKRIKKFNENIESVDSSDPNKDWNDAFNAVADGLKESPIVYKDSHNSKGPIYLEDVLKAYEESGNFPDFDSEEFLNSLVDIVAFFVDSSGYKIVKKD